MQVIMTDNIIKLENQIDVEGDLKEILDEMFAEHLRYQQLEHFLLNTDRTSMRLYNAHNEGRDRAVPLHTKEVTKEGIPIWLQPNPPAYQLLEDIRAEDTLLSGLMYQELCNARDSSLKTVELLLVKLLSRYNMVPLTNWAASTRKETENFLKIFNYRLDKIVKVGKILDGFAVADIAERADLDSTQSMFICHYPFSSLQPSPNMRDEAQGICEANGVTKIYVSEREYRTTPMSPYYYKTTVDTPDIPTIPDLHTWANAPTFIDLPFFPAEEEVTGITPY